MPRSTDDHEPDDDEDDGYDPDDDSDDEQDYDPDDPETYPAGVYDDDGPASVPCPYCKRPIFEDAERCPHCENYVSREDSPPGSKSKFWFVLMVLALLAAAAWVLGG